MTKAEAQQQAARFLAQRIGADVVYRETGSHYWIVEVDSPNSYFIELYSVEACERFSRLLDSPAPAGQ